jgi:polysaccharide export outer membrane protein
LGGGDTIFIDVFQVPQYSGNYQIPIDGNIFMPLIGQIPLQGLSLGAASERISNAYAQFLRRPLINIRLINARPVNISIGGEVNRPGSYTVVLTPGVNPGLGLISGVQYPTVLQTIQQAGGVNLTADLNNVQLRRSSNPNIVYTVNIFQILQTGDRSQDPTLRDGDSIFVPTGNNQTLLEALQITNLGIGADIRQPRNIAVVGEVNRPGFYTLVGAADNSVTVLGGFPTVSGAIQQAGGIKPFADVRNIQVRRYTSLGQERSFTVSLWDLLQGGDITQDTVLQNGDTIIVPTATTLTPGEATALAEARFAPSTIKVSIVGEVVRPGAVEVPPNTPLNQAILTAGGFKDDRANQTVQLIRLNPDGTVSRQDFAADFAQGINTQNNPILQNQDIIVVSRNTSANILDVLSSLLNPFSGLGSLLNIFR